MFYQGFLSSAVMPCREAFLGVLGHGYIKNIFKLFLGEVWFWVSLIPLKVAFSSRHHGRG